MGRGSFCAVLKSAVFSESGEASVFLFQTDHYAAGRLVITAVQRCLFVASFRNIVVKERLEIAIRLAIAYN